MEYRYQVENRSTEVGKSVTEIGISGDVFFLLLEDTYDLFYSRDTGIIYIEFKMTAKEASH